MTKTVLAGLFIFVGCSFVASQAKSDYAIEGTVTDFFGVPWEGAIITLKSMNTEYRQTGPVRIERQAISDSSGKYRFSNLPSDSYEVTLSRNNSLSTLEESKRTGVLFGEKVYEVNFGVEIGTVTECRYSIAGTVRDRLGNILSGATVSVFNVFKQQPVVSGKSDGKGRFSIKICNLGQYIVFSSAPKYEAQATHVVFENYRDYQKNVDLVLAPLTSRVLNWRK